MSRIKILLAVIMMSGVAVSGADGAGFSFQDKPGEHLDVLLDGKVAVRYMNAHDVSTPARQHETYKPYLHVFNAEGAAPITKGAGGRFTHHRGIFIGWSKVAFSGKTYDLWHMKATDIIHQKFTEQKADSEHATFTSLNHWIIEKDKTILEEERTFVIKRAAAPARLVIDFTSKLKAVAGDLVLDGDPEHAGIHYRPADELDSKQTVYVYPKEGADATKDLDYPWAGETYTLAGKKHSVVHMNHPDNPKNTRYSAYRDYGRFGAFPKGPVKSGETFTVKYRFLIADGDMPAVEMIQKTWDEYAGVSTPSPAPKVTIKEVGKPKAK